MSLAAMVLGVFLGTTVPLLCLGGSVVEAVTWPFGLFALVLVVPNLALLALLAVVVSWMSAYFGGRLSPVLGGVAIFVIVGGWSWMSFWLLIAAIGP